jgi:hypothetical protein
LNHSIVIAPSNRLFQSEIEIAEEGLSPGSVSSRGGGLSRGGRGARATIYFKMMDDAAFYACNSLVTDRFLLTTAFNLHFTRPIKSGPVVAEGRWASGRRRVYVADTRLIGPDGEEAARGTGTFMRSHISLSTLPGYRPD